MASPGRASPASKPAGSTRAVRADHHHLGTRYLYAEPEATLLFCENETNAPRVFSAEPTTPYPKDGIGDHVIHGADTVNPRNEGTKAAAHVRLRGTCPRPRDNPHTPHPRGTARPVRDGRRTDRPPPRRGGRFYDAITPPTVSEDAKQVMRQALAGMLWSKQCYYFDVDQWLRERRFHPLRTPSRRGTRNESWYHMFNHDVVSMPDKWEYPWYAAWDLAFHCIPLAMVDPDFAKTPDRPDDLPGLPAPDRPDARL